MHKKILLNKIKLYPLTIRGLKYDMLTCDYHGGLFRW